MKGHPLTSLVPRLSLANGIFRDFSLVTLAFLLLIIFLA